jgi:phenylalanyl-tRNA synthetase beta chain
LKALDFAKAGILSVNNPLNIDFEYLRPTLLINLLKKSSQEASSPSYFEIGRVFKKDSANQPYMAGLISRGSFFEAKAAVGLAMSRLGIRQVDFLPLEGKAKNAFINVLIYDDECAAVIYANKKEVGIVGRITDKLSKIYGNTSSPMAIELVCGELEALASENIKYMPESAYPAAIRDLSVLVLNRTYVREIISIIRAAGGRLLENAEVFESYEGKGVPEGKKNVALTLVFQSYDKTLTAAEVDVLMKTIIGTLEKQPGWQVRK